MTEEKKVFEDWEVDCNSCTRYWDSSCDGVKKNKNKPCNAFLATRSIILPEELKRLKKQINSVRISGILLGIALIIHVIDHMIN